MKKFVLTGIVAAVFFVQQGCVPLSTYPAYTHKDVVYDPNLLGKWSGNPITGGPMVAEFTPAEVPKLYTLSLQWKNKQGKARAVLFRLDNQMFLDIAPTDGNDVFADMIFIPAHLTVRVDRISPQIQFAPMSKTSLQDIITADAAAVDYYNFGEKTMLTCSTLRLRKFVAQHAKDNLFGGIIILKPVKENAPPAAIPNTNRVGAQKE